MSALESHYELNQAPSKQIEGTCQFVFGLFLTLLLLDLYFYRNGQIFLLVSVILYLHDSFEVYSLRFCRQYYLKVIQDKTCLRLPITYKHFIFKLPRIDPFHKIYWLYYLFWFIEIEYNA